MQLHLVSIVCMMCVVIVLCGCVCCAASVYTTHHPLHTCCLTWLACIAWLITLFHATLHNTELPLLHISPGCAQDIQEYEIALTINAIM